MYTYDDSGNAERFRDKFKDIVKYNATNKKWMYYNGKKWCSDDTLHVMLLSDEVIEDIRLEAIEADKEKMDVLFKLYRNTRMLRGKKNMIEAAKPLMPILPSELDTWKTMFNCENEIVALSNSFPCSREADRYITKISRVEWEKDAKCDKWLKFLDDIFLEDKELIKYIQKAIGYSMSGDISEQCAFFCYGDGSNGKSTFLDIINHIMGDYATNIQPESLMVGRGSTGSGATPDIARLKGARFVTCVESGSGNRLNEGLIKQMTGGDKITARFLHGDFFDFVPEFKLWMVTNHKPIIRGTDKGIWRRIKLIPFKAEITEEKKDPQLLYKLQNEVSGILNWCLEGYVLWKKEGLGKAKIIEEATKQYKEEMDVITGWIDDCCSEDKEYWESAKSLFESYCQWAESNNEYKMTVRKFNEEMAKKFPKKRMTTGYCYNGIKLHNSTEYNHKYIKSVK